jgi:aryl carrier-like protein
MPPLSQSLAVEQTNYKNAYQKNLKKEKIRMSTATKIVSHDLNTVPREIKPASTVLEKSVLAYLSEIFEYPIDSLLDNFLELGGGSLKAAQLITRLKENGYTASMEDVFNSKNLATFVAKIEQEEVSA